MEAQGPVWNQRRSTDSRYIISNDRSWATFLASREKVHIQGSTNDTVLKYFVTKDYVHPIGGKKEDPMTRAFFCGLVVPVLHINRMVTIHIAIDWVTDVI